MSFLSGIFGGDDKYQAQNFADTKNYDPNAWYAGGDKNWAPTEANYVGSIAQQADQRNPNFAYANQSRGSQLDALGLAQQAAYGGAPSASEIQGRLAADQALRQQMSLAAGARGSQGLAMAQQQAAWNTAAAQQGIAGQAMAGRAQEMANARGAYLQGAQGLRAEDLNTTQLGLMSRQINDQRNLEYMKMREQLMQNERAAMMARQAFLSGTFADQQQINSGVAAGNANRDTQYGTMAFQGAMKAGEGGLGGMGQLAGIG